MYICEILVQGATVSMQSKFSVWEDLIKESRLKSRSIAQSKAETGTQMEIHLGYRWCRKTSVMSWSENLPIRKRLSLTAYHQTVWVSVLGCLRSFASLSPSIILSPLPWEPLLTSTDLQWSLQSTSKPVISPQFPSRGSSPAPFSLSLHPPQTPLKATTEQWPCYV